MTRSALELGMKLGKKLGMKHRLIPALGALSLALAGLLVPAGAPASAAPAPWTWVRVTVPVSVAPNSFYSIDATCPAGYTAITGGLQLPFGSRLERSAEYRYSDGSGWFVSFENTSGARGSATVVAECVETADLPPISYNHVDVTASSGYAETVAPCLNPGEVVLTGGVDWSNVNRRWIDYSGPAWNEQAWIASGYNTVSGAVLTVEVYCVDPGNVPGFQKLEQEVGGGGNLQHTLTCPQGKRILTGGTQTHAGGFTNGSAPHINKWTATLYHYYPSYTTYVRAFCVNAGTPTIQLTLAEPTGGSVTSSPTARFQFQGSDPAGFPSGFRCSLDGSAPSLCFSDWTYSDLASGPHTFVVFNQTPDGRSSGVASVHWTVDRTLPDVTAPVLTPVTLVQGLQVAWTGSDQHSGIDHYEAAYWLAHADGTVDGWSQPTDWQSLSAPSVQLPQLAPGDSICLAVRAEDGVENKSAWATPTCTSRPYDDRALTASSGWTRGSGSVFWRQTVTIAKASAKTLKRTGVVTSRVGILASTCGRCGAVDVKVGATAVGRISLRSETVKHKQVLLLPAFSPTPGAVSLKTANLRKVQIDGLVVIRTTTGPPVLP